MGNCNCGSNARPTGFGTNPRDEQRQQQEAVANQRQALNGAQQQARDSGSRTQSFTLRDRAGQVQHFGSALERSAFMARQGGTIV
ncbi:hypothetical protein SEA_RASPUTIA_55 [Microbacterium phage Rasputia]|nr:hypothetical protein SEA_RASPUTIA_55 [Microbacterium phage Rasputia]